MFSHKYPQKYFKLAFTSRTLNCLMYNLQESSLADSRVDGMKQKAKTLYDLN